MAEAKNRTVSPEARRPLSPHLQIYRPMLTMMMSIMHRITGMALYAGTLLLAWWLIAAATDAARLRHRQFGADVHPRPDRAASASPGRLFHHLLGGIRHFIWDTGRGMDHPEREYLAQATLIGGFVLTAVVWIIAYTVR